MENEKVKGKRFNEGKTRFSLINTYAHEEKAKVFTFGANKYGDHNWENGFDWLKVLDSAERHLNAFKKGEDYDEESGLLHVAHLACNVDMLIAFYKIYPEGDNRRHWYLNTKRIGLDIDEVIADFGNHYNAYFNTNITQEYWNFDANMSEKLKRIQDDKDFWLTMPPKTAPSKLPFEPYCYITSRGIPSSWSEEWIANLGFPTMPVYTVQPNESKLELCKKHKIDIFVDDRFDNFVELNKNGICCYLYDAPHNRRYNVGYKRIYSLHELEF